MATLVICCFCICEGIFKFVICLGFFTCEIWLKSYFWIFFIMDLWSLHFLSSSQTEHYYIPLWLPEVHCALFPFLGYLGLYVVYVVTVIISAYIYNRQKNAMNSNGQNVVHAPGWKNRYIYMPLNLLMTKYVFFCLCRRLWLIWLLRWGCSPSVWWDRPRRLW